MEVNMSKQVIHSDNAPAAIGPYSQAIAVPAGQLLFCSGQIALRPDGSFVDGDAATQARQSMNNLGEVLKAANMDFSHVTRCTIFMLDLNDYAAVNAVYAEYFGDKPPSRAAVEVSRLPRDARVEIDCIAVR